MRESNIKVMCDPHKKCRVLYSTSLNPTHVSVHVLLLAMWSWLLRLLLNFVEQHMPRYHPHSCTPLMTVGSVEISHELSFPWGWPNLMKLLLRAYPARRLYQIYEINRDSRPSWYQMSQVKPSICYSTNIKSHDLRVNLHIWTFFVGAIRVRTTWKIRAIFIKSAGFHTMVRWDWLSFDLKSNEESHEWP